MIYACCDERRLEAVREGGVLNGIAYLEVLDSGDPTDDLRQRTLVLRLLLAPPGSPDELTPDNVSITGGERIPTVDVTWVRAATDLTGADADLVADRDDLATVLVIRTEEWGDFSTYTLRLRTSAVSEAPPATFDPLLAEVDFSFKVECPSDFDCADDEICPPEAADAPTIDYLAKDYPSFRRLMLDRLDLTTPGWSERSPADVGMALVEVMAYLGDELSYRQDAVATEAYLGTARRRPSLRRLARLVDYTVHEGNNARAWVQLAVNGENVPVAAADTQLLTRVPGLADRIEAATPPYTAAISSGAEVFELLEDVTLHESLATLHLYTWGDAECCLPTGATSATISGHHAALAVGQVLVLAEVAGPTTAQPADADPSHRQAVRLTAVTERSDPSGGRFKATPDNSALDVTDLEWDPEDALTFPLCISTGAHPNLEVSQVWGNVVLADHGRTIPDEDLGTVPDSVLTYALAGTGGQCDPADDEPVPVRFRPSLAFAPLTHAHPAPVAVAAPGISGGTALPSARASVRQDVRTASAAVTADSLLETVPDHWTPLVDLLGSESDDTNFVVEVDNDSTARLRFGDDTHGRRPGTGSSFRATYRVGNGTAGNVGLGAIAHVVSTDGRITGVVNPLPGVGGTDPESADDIRRDAPEAFLVQQRAVTADDYAEVTERSALVQRAAATFRWTGSWHTVFVTADRAGGGAVDRAFETTIRSQIEPFRMAGYDLEVDAPALVSLEVALHVCVVAEYFRSQVRAAVFDVLSSGRRRDGGLGFFHADRFTFAQPVYLSAIVATAQAVPGVESVSVVTFQRQRDPLSSGIDEGVLEMGRLEIARLDNDPSFPERGVLTITAGGGK